MIAKTHGTIAQTVGGFVLVSIMAAACTQRAPLKLGESESNLKGLTGTVSITLAAPKGMPPMGPVLLGADSLDIRSGANVETGTVVSMGNGGMVANDALLNDAWSVGPVRVLARADIRGTLHATNVSLENGAVVPSWDNAPTFEPNSVVKWDVTYPSVPSTNDVTVLQGGSATVEPGAYRSIVIYSGGTATMSTGTYYLSMLDLEPSSKLLIDQTAGPVLIYTSDVLIHRGTIASTNGGTPDVLLGHLGTSEVVIESVFRGGRARFAERADYDPGGWGYPCRVFRREIDITRCARQRQISRAHLGHQGDQTRFSELQGDVEGHHTAKPLHRMGHPILRQLLLARQYRSRPVSGLC